MFKNCINLKNVTLPETINTYFLYETNEMFSGCEKIENLNLSKLITVRVKSMKEMFYGCSSLKNLDISKFNTRNLESCDNIFGGINNSINIKYNEEDKNLSNEIKKISGNN